MGWGWNHLWQALLRAAVVLGAFVWPPAYGQPVPAGTYPTKVVRVVVPFAAGSVTDVLTRLIAQKLSERLGQSFIVENKPGAGGNLGAELVAKSASDGYTLLMATGNHTINMALYRNLAYDTMRNFAPVVFCASAPTILAVHPAVPVKTVGELLALSKARPGELNFGSAGSGSAQHLGAELFKSMARVDMVHVPFNGAAPAVTGILAGQVDVQFIAMPLALPHVKTGKLRALAVTSSMRSPIAAELPTVGESGVPGFELSVWYGLLAPAGTPNEVIKLLNQEITRILLMADVQDRFAGLGADIKPGSPDQFRSFIKEDIAKWAKVVKESGARVD